VICGSGGHHRTLACFLWGAGELTGEITVVDELADEELHAACRLIDSRLPNPTQGLAIRHIPMATPPSECSCSISPSASKPSDRSLRRI
jgi:hypothetical protein